MHIEQFISKERTKFLQYSGFSIAEERSKDQQWIDRLQKQHHRLFSSFNRFHLPRSAKSPTSYGIRVKRRWQSFKGLWSALQLVVLRRERQNDVKILDQFLGGLIGRQLLVHCKLFNFSLLILSLITKFILSQTDSHVHHRLIKISLS